MLERLSERDRQIIVQCMEIVLREDWPPGELEARVGLDPATLTKVITVFRQLRGHEYEPASGASHGVRDGQIDLAVNNCLNEVCYGIRAVDSALRDDLGFGRDDAEAVFKKWRRLYRMAHGPSDGL